MAIGLPYETVMVWVFVSIFELRSTAEESTSTVFFVVRSWLVGGRARSFCAGASKLHPTSQIKTVCHRAGRRLSHCSKE